jgi:hypothetical protein
MAPFCISHASGRENHNILKYLKLNTKKKQGQ